MKRLVAIFLSIAFCLFSLSVLAGCDTYKVPENNCIVGLYKDYRLYSYTESQLCEPIEKGIKGIEKQDGWNYYSVTKNALYSIVVDGLVDDNAGFGSGINDSISSAWWQGNIITSFKKEYDEKSGLQDEVFFTTHYKTLSNDVDVTFSENCTVKAITEPYLYVGGIYDIVANDTPIESYCNVIDYIDIAGNVEEKDGLYYLLLNDEVCVHRDAWKTNLEITDYSYQYLEDGWGKPIQAQFTCKPIGTSDNEKLLLYIICKTYGGNYFAYPLIFADTQGFGMPIREHELKLTFDR